MEGETFDELMDRLSDKQDAVTERGNEVAVEEDQQAGPREMYFRGKDMGVAEAKAILREEVEVER